MSVLGGISDLFFLDSLFFGGYLGIIGGTVFAFRTFLRNIVFARGFVSGFGG